MSVKVITATAGALVPATIDTPLDVRARVSTLAEITSILYPYVGEIVYCTGNGLYYKISAINEEGSVAAYDSISSTSEASLHYFTDSGLTISIPETAMPIYIIAPSGKLYNIEADTLTYTSGQLSLSTAYYKAYENIAAADTPVWTVCYIGNLGESSDSSE